MTSWLLLDVNYLGYRAFHSTGQLSFDDNPTGVIYGILSEAIRAMDRFGTRQVCWCFDYGKPKRLEALPSYKSTRKKKRAELSDEEKERHKEMKHQLFRLRQQVLPSMGFKNVFAANGFEADDIIASLVGSIPSPHEAIVVSSDEDMFQLLGPRCLIWNPNKSTVMTHGKFREVYGIVPSQWIDVKAMAGCSSDDIPGIVGVGEKTAIKYLRGTLNPKTRTYAKFHGVREVLDRNLPLVSLPFEGCPTFKRKRDRVTKEKWQNVCHGFGFHSLIDQAPCGPSLIHGT